jgi:thiosulfate/3-mercaptopyruvate sulfurtransferase
VSPPAARYTASEQDGSIRALRDEVLRHVKAGRQLLDVRSPEEYRGERMHMPDYPNEGAVRGGHIPGAVNVPWARACNDDGTFKSVRDLEKLYLREVKLKRRSPTIAYCRIGERSSLTWFVLSYLLGFANVKNYDGSWLEWGNAVRVPIAKGEHPGGVGQPAAVGGSPDGQS